MTCQVAIAQQKIRVTSAAAIAAETTSRAKKKLVELALKEHQSNWFWVFY